MTLLYFDPFCFEHQTGNHPENAQRVRRAMETLQENGLAKHCTRKVWVPASAEQIRLVHPNRYVENLEAEVVKGGGRIEADTVVSPKSVDVARITAGAALDAVEQVVRGQDCNAFCLMRPPGHHALVDAPMGFCLFNHAAIAAKYAIDGLGLNRVMVVDWDVHHGNGTQDIFWTDPAVGFFSMHRFPFYPGSGEASEVGSGDGLGTTVNLPIQLGTSRELQRKAFRLSLEKFALKIRPELIIISAGFDGHHLDPVGALGLESEDYVEFTKIVLDIASVHAAGRVVSLLEGGYNPDALAESVSYHLQTLLDASTEKERVDPAVG